MAKNPELSVQIYTKELYELRSFLQSSEADYIITNEKSDSPDIESVLLGYEENVLVKAKKSSDNDIYLDHDEDDPITKSFFALQKLNFKPKLMRYLDDVYGIIDGVKLGYGKAILPRHLIENEKDLEVLDSKKVLWVSVYLQYFKQPFYRQTHSAVVEDLIQHFSKTLAQAK